MTSQHKKITLLLAIVLIFGTVLRFRPGELSGFPLNDGGMLLAMIRDLRSNHFLLPFATSYNFSNIPFVYPPFGMYLASILSSLFPGSDLEVLRWLPALVSAATMPAFYWLSLQIVGSTSKAFIATALYALMPGSSDWFIMGGGLTRSLGTLFYLFAIGYVHQLFREPGNKTLIGLATLFCTLAVLSHPEVGLQTAAVCFLFWLYDARSSAGTKSAAYVALGTAISTSPWWLTVLHYHGFVPFWSAIHTGIHETLLASLFHAFFTTQGGLPILTVCELMGMLVVLRKREPLLLLWAIMPFFVDPRNGSAIAMFPLLMLASEGLQFLGMGLTRAYLSTFPKDHQKDYSSVVTQGSFIIVLLFLFFVAYRATSNVVAISLSEADRETMQWIRNNTPTESSFLLITSAGQVSPMADSFQEWFPVLAERRARNILQGLEWTLGPDFFAYSQQLLALQACPDANCLNKWLQDNNIEVDFILFQKKRISQKLITSLRSDQRYKSIYESANAELFAFDP